MNPSDVSPCQPESYETRCFHIPQLTCFADIFMLELHSAVHEISKLALTEWLI